MCTLVFPKYLICSFVVLCAIVLLPSTKGCNQFVCGSVVSKCLLTRSCQCELADCFCCKDCLNCLGELYPECCGCLDMCPKHNDTSAAVGPKSQIGDFEGVPELFDTLTAEDDLGQWTTIRFPMRTSLQRHFNMAKGSFGQDFDQTAYMRKKYAETVNCTVIYLNTCTSTKKCTKYCESMGAKSYRWFHDGCCECVGANCYNYGINESRCSDCPYDEEEKKDSDYAEESTGEMFLDFGEDQVN